MELFAHQLEAVKYFTDGAPRVFNNNAGKFNIKGGTSWLLADGPRVPHCVRVN